MGASRSRHAASSRRLPVRARRRVSSAESSEVRARATRAGRRRRTSRAAREEQRFRMLPAPAAARTYAPDRGALGPGSGGRYSGRGSNGSTATRCGWPTSFDPKMCCCCDMTTVPRTRSMCTAWTPRRQAGSTINSRGRIDRSHERRRTRPRDLFGDDRSSGPLRCEGRRAVEGAGERSPRDGPRARSERCAPTSRPVAPMWRPYEALRRRERTWALELIAPDPRRRWLSLRSRVGLAGLHAIVALPGRGARQPPAGRDGASASQGSARGGGGVLERFIAAGSERGAGPGNEDIGLQRGERGGPLV